MRYELKYEIKNWMIKPIELYLICNGFTEIYKKRRVNSLYYDDHDFTLFKNSEDGISQRNKIRLRFYGLNNDDKIVVENKIKSENINWKKFDNYFKNNEEIVSVIFENNQSEFGNISAPKIIEDSYVPRTFVSYKRKYFISYDNNYRFTLDTDITIWKATSNLENIIINNKFHLDDPILELKYDLNNLSSETIVKNLLNEFNLVLSRTSKYCKSVIGVY